MPLQRLLKRLYGLTKHIKSCYNNAMDGYKDIKRTSLYIPLELAEKIQSSAMVHRRSFNQELLWLAEQGLSSQEKTPDRAATWSGVVKA